MTDHSEYAGTVRLANTPGSPISKLPIAEKLMVHDAADIQRIYLWLGHHDRRQADQGIVVPAVAGTFGKKTTRSPTGNEPGKFTAFCSYEWTSTPDFRNMHRNVFFKDCAKVPGCRSARSIRTPRGSMGLDGWPAQGRQRVACDLA